MQMNQIRIPGFDKFAKPMCVIRRWKTACFTYGRYPDGRNEFFWSVFRICQVTVMTTCRQTLYDIQKVNLGSAFSRRMRVDMQDIHDDLEWARSDGSWFQPDSFRKDFHFCWSIRSEMRRGTIRSKSMNAFKTALTGFELFVPMHERIKCRGNAKTKCFRKALILEWLPCRTR